MKLIVKRILFLTGGILSGAILIVTLLFASHSTADVKCREITVKYFSNKNIQLSSNELIRMVKASDPKIIGKKLKEIDTEAIESRLSKNPTILKAAVYKKVVRDSAGYKGIIGLNIKHRNPRLRIVSPQGNFYMDDTGHKFPVSVNYAANVPVITGNVSLELAKTDLLPFVEFIQKNKFWKAQIKQIHVNSGSELLLTTLVGNHLIEFGTADNMEEKFRNLRAFYDQILSNNNWNKYKRIILKFDNQVIAKKN
jgi:cell division protein FtsQ